jgi:hypothetical protein
MIKTFLVDAEKPNPAQALNLPAIAEFICFAFYLPSRIFGFALS